MNDQTLIDIAKGFRRGLLGKSKSDGMCFAVCAPLQTILELEGLKSRMLMVDFHFSNHMFLLLPDGRILDPTADQFPKSALPPVYLGPLPEIYKSWMEKKIKRSKKPKERPLQTDR